MSKNARVAQEGRVGDGFSSGMKIEEILRKKTEYTSAIRYFKEMNLL